MAGDTANVAVWSDADVYIGALAATNPTAGADFTLNATSGGTGTGNWDFVGLLDGSAGFGESQAFDSTDFNAWGHGVIKTSRKNLVITRTFTALEDNLTTLGLRYDASGVTDTSGTYAGDLKERDLNEMFKIAFDLREGTTVKRVISDNYAQIDAIGDASEGEDALATVSVTVKIYPSSDGTVWNYYKGPAS